LEIQVYIRKVNSIGQPLGCQRLFFTAGFIIIIIHFHNLKIQEVDYQLVQISIYTNKDLSHRPLNAVKSNI